MNTEERKLFWETLNSLDGKNVAEDSNRLLATIKYPPFIYRYRAVTVNNIDVLQNMNARRLYEDFGFKTNCLYLSKRTGTE